MTKEFELSLSLVCVTKEFGVVQVCWCSTGVLHKCSSVQNWRNWHAVKEVVVPLRIRLHLPYVLISPHSSTVSCHTSDPTIKTLMRHKGDCCLFCCCSLFLAAEAIYLSILPFSNAASPSIPHSEHRFLAPSSKLSELPLHSWPQTLEVTSGRFEYWQDWKQRSIQACT